MQRDLVIARLAFISGFCALGYQVLYLRHLTIFLGDSLHVHAAMLGTFLLGIATGARLAYLSHRWLALVELGAGLYAFALPLLTWLLSNQGGWAIVAATPTLTMLTMALLVAPAALMIGVGVPLYSGYVKATLTGTGRAFERVYSRYNLGAFCGIVVIEGLLVAWLGIRASLHVLGFLNMIVGAVLLWVRATDIRRPALLRHRFAARTLLAVCLASTASALVQMLLLRSLDLVLGPHRSNFAAGLAVILLGLSLGAWIASRTRASFQAAMGWLPVVLLPTYLILISPVGLFHDGAVALTDGFGLAGFAERFLYAAALGLAPMVLFGITLPALMRQERAVAREAGELLWFSGLANAGGYLMFVAFLHPLLPGWGLLAIVAMLALIAAWLAYDFGAGKALSKSLRKGLVFSAMTVVLLIVAGATWDDVDFHLASTRSRISVDDQVHIYRWAGESASLIQSSQRTWLSYNGHPSIVVESRGVTSASELLSGVIPALTAPSTERAMVLGLGSGITAGAAARVFEQVEVAEINGAFLMLVPDIAFSNLLVHANPNANIHLVDGRSLLGASAGQFDAIINSVPAPTYYSAGKIYTLEFYQMVRDALRDGGVFSTWVSTGDMTEAGVLTVISTLKKVFAHCELRTLRGGYLFVTCSDRPLQPRDFGELNVDPMLERRLRQSLAPFDPAEYLSDILLSPDMFRGNLPVAPINTDNRPILEFKVLPPRFPTARGFDPVIASPESFAVEVGDLGGMSPERYARRAAVLYRIYPALFQAYFLPQIQADQALKRAWQAWYEGVDYQ